MRLDVSIVAVLCWSPWKFQERCWTSFYFRILKKWVYYQWRYASATGWMNLPITLGISRQKVKDFFLHVLLEVTSRRCDPYLGWVSHLKWFNQENLLKAGPPAWVLLVPDVVKLITKISNQTCLYLYLANTLLCALFLFWGCKSSHNLVYDGNVIWSSMTVFLGCAHSYLAQNKLFLNLFRSRILFTTSIRYHSKKKKQISRKWITWKCHLWNCKYGS